MQLLKGKEEFGSKKYHQEAFELVMGIIEKPLADLSRMAGLPAARGAELLLDATTLASVPPSLDAGDLPEALRQLLDDPAFRVSAEAIAAEIAALPDVAECLPLLEDLAG